MYFQQYSSAPPAALPRNAAGNFPSQPFPIAAPGGPYVQQPQVVEPCAEMAQPAAPDAVYPEPVPHIDSPYPQPVQLVQGTCPQRPPQPVPGTVGIDPGQGFYAPVTLGASGPQPALAYTADGLVEFQAEPWGVGTAAEAMAPDIEPHPSAGRRRRRAPLLGRSPSDWVFCLTVTLVLLLAVLVALAYFSYQKLIAMRRRRPRHEGLLAATTKFWQLF
ncbi:uncharacterized protein LOC125946544 [Dermacentor silvarum]|uniref:uncharacterized protein LOC125946544 n=1 Tax=Dermacentor silvarum TaxID=543639 RepID=UPI00210175A3|nr:uncharacterized protein LOC125946544 [Dermacentor silvarum]